METLTRLLEQEHWLMTLALLIAVLIPAWLLSIVLNVILKRVLAVAVKQTRWDWDDELFKQGFFRRLTQILIPLTVQFALPFIPDLPPKLVLLLGNLTAAAAILFTAMAVGAVPNTFNALFERRSSSRSIKSYIQLAKLVVAAFALIAIVSVLIDKSPVILLSGLGAMSALLLLLFRDTLLSFVASILLASNDMLRVGDWIEMAQVGADGEVIDIALHTVKVRNWDNTITTIPTWRLINESFKNWRGMKKSGGRRIKRSLYIDTNTIGFLSDEQISELSKLALLREYLQRTRDDVAAANARLGDDAAIAANLRRLTNIGTFRAYALTYLQQQDNIHRGMTCLVRLLQPSAEGVAVEIYCFTSTTDWVQYERIQGDIFDHLLAILPVFGLQLFQSPAGADMRALSEGVSNKAERPGA